MGNIGDKLSNESTLQLEYLVSQLSDMSDTTIKKMFGGNGIFCSGKMFGTVDSKGLCCLKANETLLEEFVTNQSTKYSQMPYTFIPIEVLNDDKTLKFG